MRRQMLLSALVAALVVLAGCDNRGQETDLMPPTSVVPDLVGMRLDVAEQTLKDLPLGFQAIGPRGPVTSDLASWEVCRTNPGEGFELPVEARIEIVVARRGRC